MKSRRGWLAAPVAAPRTIVPAALCHTRKQEACESLTSGERALVDEILALARRQAPTGRCQPMTRQLNIRNDRAFEAAQRVAERLHETTTQVVVEALRRYEQKTFRVRPTMN